MKLLNRFWPIILPVILTVIFFWQFIFKGLIPIPADTIVGLYNPYRDFYANKYPRGVPFKNFLITDPVRQQYPWKNLVIGLEKSSKLPLWNPYSFSGTPLLANFQSGAFYPLNLLFFVFPSGIAWGIYISSETFLMSLFMFLFLRNLKLSSFSSTLGAIVFSISGYSVSWLEWGNILHTLLWLPLILLSIDKILESKKVRWPLVFLGSLIFSFLAGHTQIFFYVFGLSFLYAGFRLLRVKDKSKAALLIFLIFSFCLLTFYQWGPALRFIAESARSLDQSNWQIAGWFIPWQNLVQFFVPDFFGNPATLNYWGIFNYGEFVGYVGIIPLILATYGLFFKRDKNVLFFGSILFLSLIFSLPTVIAKIPFILKIPFLSTAQPTRLISIIDFSLSVLAAFGLDALQKEKRGIYKILVFFGLIFLILWGYVLKFNFGWEIVTELNISKSNLILPSILFITSVAIFSLNKIKRFKFFNYFIIAVVLFDLLRFGWKFTPFTSSNYLYPKTNSLSFLEDQPGQFRIMTTDSRIFTPNFSVVYRIQSIEGYDPLYLKRYGELVAASERKNPDINPPFGFNRIITPHNFDSEIMDLMNVRYILSLSDLNSPKLKKVYQEGETRIYENEKVIPRTFFVKRTVEAKGENDSIKKMFQIKQDFKNTAVVEGFLSKGYAQGNSQIIKYNEGKILISTQNNGEGFLVLTDSFYPTWRAKIDGKETKIYLSDFNFRGIVVPAGNHNIEFYINIL